jgi:hypothetical protein
LLSRYNEGVEYHKKYLEIAQQTGKIDQSDRTISNILILACSLLSAGDRAGGGTACFNIALAYKQQQDQASALEYTKRAHETWQSCYGAEHPHTIMAHKQVEQLQRGPCRCELAAFQTEEGGFYCSECGTIVPEGTMLHGCRTCDFDLCASCFAQRQA